MRIIPSLIIALLCLVSVQLNGQSKKELKAELASIKAELTNIKTENDSLRELIIPISLESFKDTFSYAMALELQYKNFKTEGIDTLIDPEAFYLGLADSYADRDSMPIAIRNSVLRAQFTELNRAKQEKKEREAALRGKVGADFLAANAKKPGVIAFPNGLQYKVLASGDQSQASPNTSSKVTVHYKGTLINGEQFDSSYDRGRPATFGVTQVIKGWTQILQLMKPGDKWEVYIPYDLAYGDRGSGSSIGPYETLIFTVELISFK